MTERPDPPRAAAFEYGFCEDADCGLHVIAIGHDGMPIIEIVMSIDLTLDMVEACKRHLYAKAVRRE